LRQDWPVLGSFEQIISRSLMEMTIYQYRI